MIGIVWQQSNALKLHCIISLGNYREGIRNALFKGKSKLKLMFDKRVCEQKMSVSFVELTYDFLCMIKS